MKRSSRLSAHSLVHNFSLVNASVNSNKQYLVWAYGKLYEIWWSIRNFDFPYMVWEVRTPLIRNRFYIPYPRWKATKLIRSFPGSFMTSQRIVVCLETITWERTWPKSICNTPYKGNPYQNRPEKTSMGPKSAKKNRKFSETFSLAKYHPRLVEKPYGNSQNHSIRAGPRFLSQNVEYVAFIDRAPHVQSVSNFEQV